MTSTDSKIKDGMLSYLLKPETGVIFVVTFA
jgi:hypothetical protein